MNYEGVGKIKTSGVAKVLFEILENGDNTVDLDQVPGGYQQYINIKLNNIIKTFNEETQEFDRQDIYYSVDRCTKENFMKDDYEKQYFDLKKSRAQYCIDHHEDIYL